MNTNIKRIALAAIAASSFVLLISCNRSQTNEITAFCDQMANAATTIPQPPEHVLVMRIQNKIIEKEWDSEIVIDECVKSLDRKLEFITRARKAGDL